MEKKIGIGLVICLFILSLFPAPGTAQNKVIAIGYQAPLTGEHAQYGDLFRKAGTMAVDNFNKAKKMPGVEIVLKFEDSKSDPKEGVNIARKFVDDKSIVGVLGDFTSTVSMASGHVYGEAGLPQLSPTSSHPDFVNVSKWQFQETITQVQESPFNVQWAIEDLGAKRFAVVSIQNDYGRSLADTFEKTVKEAGKELVSKEYFNPGARDFRSILTKISRQKPDVIYLGMMYEEGAMFLQQSKQLNISIPCFSSGAIASPKLIELAGEAAEGLRTSAPFYVSIPLPVVKNFVEQYEKLYGKEPNWVAALSFDSANIMMEAIKRVGPDVTRAALRDSLAATKGFQGVTGETTYDPVTRKPSKSLFKLQVKGGKFVYVGK